MTKDTSLAPDDKLAAESAKANAGVKPRAQWGGGDGRVDDAMRETAGSDHLVEDALAQGMGGPLDRES